MSVAYRSRGCSLGTDAGQANEILIYFGRCSERVEIMKTTPVSAPDSSPDAWVSLPSEAQYRELVPPGGPYDFGFLPAMGRLIATHPRIGPAFSALFGAIMFAPGALTRSEREMVAAVAASAQDCFY